MQSAAEAAQGSVAAKLPTEGSMPLPDLPPPPNSISHEARAYLSSRGAEPYVAPPPLEDIEAWKVRIADYDQKFAQMTGIVLELPGHSVETRTMGGVTVHVATPADRSPEARKPHLFIHAGGFTQFSGVPAKILTKVMALYYGGVVYGVDYRTPPDHPFPVPLDDCLAAYRALLELHAPETILVSGESAGGNLAAALMLKARAAGLPPPGALFLNTPVTDLTGASDSLQTNRGVDVHLKHLSQADSPALYIGRADPNHPHLSPLMGDLSGFPSTHLRTGTRDLLLSDTVRMHAALRRAGVDADLYVGEAMPHSGLGGRSPEDVEARNDTLRWLSKYWR